MFPGSTVLPDIKESELGSSDQEASALAVKNTGGSFSAHVPTLKCVPTAISVGVDISEVFGCHFLRQTSSQ